MNINVENKGLVDLQTRRGLIIPPAILVCLYYFATLSPPNLDLRFLTWFVVLAGAFFAFLMRNRRIDFSRLKLYLVSGGLIFAGALLSLFRAPDFDLVIFNTAAFGIAFFTFLLMVPIISSGVTRWFLIATHIFGGLLWVYEIQTRADVLGYFLRSTFSGEGDNKNTVGLLLGMAVAGVLTLALHWTPDEKKSRLLVLAVRAGLVGIGIILYINLSLVYSRSQLVIGLVGIFAAVSSYALKDRGAQFVVRYLVISVVLIAVAVYVFPYVMSVSPYWNDYFESITAVSEIEELGSRGALLLKARAIITDNPLIGLGPGIAKNAYTPYGLTSTRGLIHNTFLSYWAEYGLLGFIGMLIFLGVYLKNLISNFYQRKLVDQVWMIMLVPFVLSLLVKNLPFLFYFMLILLMETPTPDGDIEEQNGA